MSCAPTSATSIRRSGRPGMSGSSGRPRRIRLVERILVNAAIKKALCRDATGDRAWLSKVRPWYWHNYHFHIRIGCPKDSPTCKPQPATPRRATAAAPSSPTGSSRRSCGPKSRRYRAAPAHDDERVAGGMPSGADRGIGSTVDSGSRSSRARLARRRIRHAARPSRIHAPLIRRGSRCAIAPE